MYFNYFIQLIDKDFRRGITFHEIFWNFYDVKIDEIQRANH